MTKVELDNPPLWEKFQALGNEMIVNNKGRRIFPTIKAKVTNLEKNEFYSLHINFVKKCSKKFANGHWLPSDRNTSSDFEEELTETFIHPNSPNYGGYWNENVVDFSKLKVTNKRDHKKDHIYLDTFYQYVPRISVFKILKSNDKQEFVCSFDFEKASFIAVTTYQNEELKNLKVAHNPYAKGQKRKYQTEDDESSPKHYSVENTNASQQIKRNSYQKFDNSNQPKVNRQCDENGLQHCMQTMYDGSLWHSTNQPHSGYLESHMHKLPYNPMCLYAGPQSLGPDLYQHFYQDYHQSMASLPPPPSSSSSTTTTPNTLFCFPSINPCTQDLNEDYNHQQFKELQNLQNGFTSNYYQRH